MHTLSQLAANKAVAQSYFDAVNSGNLVRFAELLDEEVNYWVPGNWQMSGHHSKDEILKMMTKYIATLQKPIQVIPLTFTAEDDRVAVEATSSSEHNGKTYNNHYHFLFQIKGGKIHRFHEHLDSHAAIKFFFDP